MFPFINTKNSLFISIKHLLSHQLNRVTFYLLISLFALVIMGTRNCYAQKTFNVASGNWNTAGNWNPSGVPGPGDNVTIPGNSAVTVDIAAECNSLTFTSATSVSSITISGSNSLTVTTTIRMTDPGNSSGDQTINVNAGTLICDSLIMANTSSSSEDLAVIVTTGSATIQTGFVMSGASNENALSVTSSGNLIFGGSVSSSSTGLLSLASTSTVTYNGSSSQTIRGGTYRNLVFSGGGTKTFGATVTAALDLSIEASTEVIIGGVGLTANGLTNISGTLTENNTAGTNTFAALITINPGGTWNTTVAENFIIQGGIENNGTFTSGNGTYTFNTNNQEITGSNPLFIAANVTVTGVTITNNITVTIGGTFSGTGGWINASGSYLRLNGTTLSIATFDASAGDNIVSYGRAGSQTILASTYHHLLTDSTGTYTAGSGITVNGNILVNKGTLNCTATITASAGSLLTLAANATLTLGVNSSATDVTFPAAITNVNISLGAGSTVNYNTNGSQTFRDGISYHHLNFNTGNIAKVITPAANVVVSGNLSVNNNTASATLDISTFNLDINGNLSGNGIITVTSGSINLAGNNTSSGTFTPGSGTFTYDGSGAQTVRGATYSALIFSGSGTKTSAASAVANGKVTIDAGVTFNCDNDNFTANDSLVISGTFTDASASGTNTINHLRITSGGTLNCTVANAFSISGSINNEGTFTSGTGTYTFITAGTKNLYGTLAFGSGISIATGVTVQNAGNVTITGNIVGSATSSTWENLSNSSLTFSGSMLTTGTLTASASPNTITYNHSGSVTIKVATYHNLIKTGAGTATTGSGTITINNALTINDGTIICTSTLTSNSGASVTMAAGTTLQLGATNSSTNVGLPTSIPAINYTLGANSNILFNTNGTQTFDNSIPYQNLTLATGTTSKTITAAGNLSVNGSLVLTSGSGTLTLAMGSHSLDINEDISGTDNLTFSSGTFTLAGNSDGHSGTFTMGTGSSFIADGSALQSLRGGTYYNFTLDNAIGAELTTNTTIDNRLQINTGNLNTLGNSLTIASNASRTAQIGTGNAGGGYITGNVTVQRFFPGGTRRWAFVSSPVTTSNGIDDNWQVNTPITGPSGTGGTACTSLSGSPVRNSSDGLDPTQSGAYSMFRYNTGTNAWTAIDNTLSTELQSGIGYRMYMRGERTQGCSILYNPPATPIAVTLSATGTLAQGNQNISCNNNANGWTLVGNPFAATVDWNAIGKTNITGTYYIFNPNVGPNGQYGSWNGLTGTNSVTQYISSGQAFFVRTISAGSASLAVEEADKVTAETGSSLFKSSSVSEIRITLSDTALQDESVVLLYPGATKSFDQQFDATKLSGGLNSIYTKQLRSSTVYSINTFEKSLQADTLVLVAAVGGRNGNWTFSFNALQSIPSSISVSLYDHFTGLTYLLRNNPLVTFTTTNDTASTSLNRFYLILGATSSLPVELLSLTAINKNNTHHIEWTTATEKNTEVFIIEYSENGTDFISVGSVKASVNASSAVTYSFINTGTNTALTTHYYRLRIIDRDKSERLSAVVTISNQLSEKPIILYPMPFSDIIHINGVESIKSAILYDYAGNQVSSVLCTNNQIDLSAENLKSGIYFITLHDKNGVQVSRKKIIRQ